MFRIFVLIISFFTMFSKVISAQNAFFALYAGGNSQGIPFNSPLVRNISSQSSGSTIRQVDFSLGQGLVFGASQGFMFNENCGLELDVSYLRGGQVSWRGYSMLVNSQSLFDLSVQSQMFRIGPSFVIQPYTEETKVIPYFKIGPLIGIGSIRLTEIEETSNRKSETRTLLKEDPNIGLGAKSGVVIPLIPRVFFFVELSFNSLTFSPKEGKVQQWIEDGQDVLDSKSYSQKNYFFENRLTYFSNEPSPDLPTKRLRQVFPMSSLGLNLGIRLNEIGFR